MIDRIGAILSGGTRITDFKTGNPDNAPKAEESLQLGIYYLAVQRSDDLAEFRPVRAVELAFVKGHWRTRRDRREGLAGLAALAGGLPGAGARPSSRS